MAVRVRRAVPDDSTRMGSVHVRAWQAAYRSVMPSEYLDGLSPQERGEMWRKNIERPRCGLIMLVVEADDELCGFASLGPEENRCAEANVSELFGINIDPDYWGRGLGKRLLGCSVEALRSMGYREAVLWVVPSNERAIGLYESTGWRFDHAEREDDVLGVRVTDVRYRLGLAS